MGILDDAIREHLDLKRKHGAREAELREIEDEAFGSTEQPDPFVAGSEIFAEGPAGSAAEPSAAGSAAATQTPPPDLGNEDPTRLVEPDALREELPAAPRQEPEPREMPSSGEMPSAPSEPAPEIGSDEPDLGSYEEPTPPPPSADPIPGQTELPGQDEIRGQERLDEPVEGYQPSIESDPATERPAAEPRAAEPPAASESLEELIAEEEPFPEDSAAPPPDVPVEPGPAADRGGALEASELEPQEEPLTPAPQPESSVPDPPPPPPETGPEPPGRARGRIDVPTQEHPPPGETG